MFLNGKKNTTGNYRPVSLTFILSKVFERFIGDHCDHWTFSFKLLKPGLNQQPFPPASETIQSRILRKFSYWIMGGHCGSEWGRWRDRPPGSGDARQEGHWVGYGHVLGDKRSVGSGLAELTKDIRRSRWSSDREHCPISIDHICGGRI